MLEVIFGNYQEAVAISEAWITALEDISDQSVEMAMMHPGPHENCLSHLGTLEIAIVDDEASARVHMDFMNLPDPTDVITFHHGEIVISAEVAFRQAQEYGEPFGREIYRYFIHGLLHLAGHEDHDPEEGKVMETIQEEIVAKLWNEHLASKLS